ncbi:DUF420 domain-containing protein [Cytophagaceae bacterium ABcell3]|nr:DUF420 domain-containing protein [Cytophagaceae bacterium ABcell3]
MNTIKSNEVRNNNLYLSIIGILSIAIPVVVAVLFYLPESGGLGDWNVSFIPHFNAILNTGTTLCLLAGFYFIKNNQQKNHIRAMVTAFVLSSLFLVLYVIYHYQGTHTLFGDANGDGVVSPEELEAVGSIRLIYVFILLTHILLAAIVVPLVLLAIYFAISKQLNKHKKIVKWTFPVWLYVAITGVIVYLMISPYYA